MSFQKAHQISNELAEVVVSTALSLAATGTSNVPFPMQPAVSGKSFRVLEIGFTVSESDSVAGTDKIDVGISTDNDKFIDRNEANNCIIPSNPTVGATFSTAKGGASTWTFHDDGVDTDGNVVLERGQVLTYSHTQTANASAGILFVRLAPIISKDVFE